MYRFNISRRSRALGALLIASSLAVAACGGDDEASGSPTTTTAADTTTTPASSASTAAGDTATVDTATADTASAATQPSAGLGVENPASLPPVKIGLIVPEGGPLDVPAAGDGAEAAAQYANEHLGGLAGHEIEILRCSDKSDGASATACANKMVEEDVAAVVIAGAIAGGDQVVPIVTGAGIPYVGGVGASTAELTTPGTFFWTGGALSVLGGAAQYAKEQGIKSVHYFLIDNPAGIGALTTIGQAAYDAAGVELRFTPVPADTADPTSLVTAALADDPGAVALLADPGTCRSVLSAVKTAERDIPVLVNELCSSESVVEGLGEGGLDGTLVFRTSEVQDGSDAEAALFHAVMDQYSPGLDPTQANGGYQSMLGLVRAVNDGGLTGEPTAANLTTAIAGATDVTVPVGAGIEFSCGTSAIPLPMLMTVLCSSSVIIETIEDGTVGDVEVIDPGPLFGGGA